MLQAYGLWVMVVVITNIDVLICFVSSSVVGVISSPVVFPATCCATDPCSTPSSIAIGYLIVITHRPHTPLLKW